MNHLWFHEKWCAIKLFCSIFEMFGFIILTTWSFKMQEKLQFLDHQIVTSCIAMVNVVFLLFIWKEITWKIWNLAKSWILYMYTLGPQCKIFQLWLTGGTHGCQMIAYSGRNKWNSSEPPLISWEMMCYKTILFNLWNVWLDNFDNLEIWRCRQSCNF